MPQMDQGQEPRASRLRARDAHRSEQTRRFKITVTTAPGAVGTPPKALLAQELAIAFARPLLIFDCPYDRLDSRPKLAEICSRHFPRLFDPHHFAQAGDRTFEVTKVLVTSRRVALAKLVQEILQHCHVLRCRKVGQVRVSPWPPVTRGTLVPPDGMRT